MADPREGNPGSAAAQHMQKRGLGRFHPELGDVYEQLSSDMRELTDHIIWNTLMQQRVRGRGATETAAAEPGTTFESVLEQEKWCTNWSCTTCGSEPFRTAILEFAETPPALGKQWRVGIIIADRLLRELRGIDPSRHRDTSEYLLRWVSESVGEEIVTAALEGTDSGLLYRRMLSARDLVQKIRAENALREEPEYIAEQRARKAAAKETTHRARLATKRLRDDSLRELLGDDDASLGSRYLQMKDRAVGCLLGLAVGDALGTTLEFMPRDTYAPISDIVGGGPFALAPGTWTDDTSMALALADSLTERGSLDPVDLMRRFCSWWRKGEYSATGECFDIGITTRNALSLFEDTGEAFAGSTDPHTAGNGSLMRLAPVAIWGLRRGDALMRGAARQQSATTHGAAACLEACEAFAIMLREAILGSPFEDAVSALADIKPAEPIGAILAGSWREKQRDQIFSSGYVAHSLEAALWCVDRTDNFKDAVLLAANLGDDADTTAAITGQLAGAIYGRNGIPDSWRARVAWETQISAMAAKLI